MRRFPYLLLLVLALASLSFCRQSSSDRPVPAKTLDPEKASRLQKSHLKVTVEGPVSFTWENHVDLRVVVINEPEVTELRFLSVGIHDMKPVSDGAQFRIAFDLAGLYQGPGKYRLPAIGGTTTMPSIDPKNPEPNAPAQGLSRVYLTYFRVNPNANDPGQRALEDTHQFDNVLEPCDVQVGRGELNGKLTCPKVADASGTTVSVVMEWRKT